MPHLLDDVEGIPNLPLGTNYLSVLVRVLHESVGDCQYLVLRQLLQSRNAFKERFVLRPASCGSCLKYHLPGSTDTNRSTKQQFYVCCVFEVLSCSRVRNISSARSFASRLNLSQLSRPKSSQIMFRILRKFRSW